MLRKDIIEDKGHSTLKNKVLDLITNLRIEEQLLPKSIKKRMTNPVAAIAEQAALHTAKTQVIYLKEEAVEVVAPLPKNEVLKVADNESDGEPKPVVAPKSNFDVDGDFEEQVENLFNDVQMLRQKFQSDLKSQHLEIKKSVKSMI